MDWTRLACCGICFCFVLQLSFTACLQPSVANDRSSSSNNSNNSNGCYAATANLALDVERLKHTIRSGRVYQQHDFFSEKQVQQMLNEILELEKRGAFAPSGLSNTVKKEQGFGRNDRTTCVVPWWADALARTFRPEDDVAPKLQQLRLSLSELLDRPTMKDPALAHECYFSTSDPGSFLPRHMDERHEELKGAKGWLLPSRRSLSWLVYLSDPGWDLDTNGGALRTFPQQHAFFDSHHRGNLQVGWLQGTPQSIPVYLDSWFQLPDDMSVPYCILYILDEGKRRIQITRPWRTDAVQGAVSDFLKRWSHARDNQGLFLRMQDAMNFVLLEDRAEWDAGRIPAGSAMEDINPHRGSLVVFDSVSLPHQVEIIHKGRRVALAGWFHEETQPFSTELFAA